jgi:hypothetical protein
MRWVWRWNLQVDNLPRENEALRLAQRHPQQPVVPRFALIGEPFKARTSAYPTQYAPIPLRFTSTHPARIYFELGGLQRQFRQFRYSLEREIEVLAVSLYAHAFVADSLAGCEGRSGACERV